MKTFFLHSGLQLEAPDGSSRSSRVVDGGVKFPCLSNTPRFLLNLNNMCHHISQ